MINLMFNIRKYFLLGSVLGLFTLGCASGPVTTQIDTSKNPVVQNPKDFQSPVTAIQKFSTKLESLSGKEKELKELVQGSLKALVMQQNAVASELKDTSRLKLKPGFSYDFTLESFCVHAGVERPIKGDGLFLGDIEGAAKSWLPQIASQYKLKKIPQNETQILIWSLLSGLRFDELSFENRKNLIKFFPDAAIRFGNSEVENSAKSFLLSQIPSEILSAKSKFDEYKNLLQDANSKFSDIEQILSPESSRSSPIPVGWLKHKDGYYIHLEADGYQQVRVKIYAPESLNPETYFNPSKHVVLPGEGQRLGLSSSVTERYKEKSNQEMKNVTGISAEEALFILKYPLDALKIYQAGQTAIEKTWIHFRSSKDFEDDKADAFRHFLWAGLVSHEIGYNKAKLFLDAHENFPKNKAESRSMDLYNNDQGIEYSKNYGGNDFEDDIVKAGLEKIQTGELRWIK